MSIIISAESTIDLSKEILAEYNIRILPFTLIMGEKVGKDGEVLGEDLFAYTKETGKLAKTTAANQEEYRNHFATLLKEADEIIHFTLSSELTSAYSNAVEAAKEFTGKVKVIDSLSLSTGIALEAIYASRLAEAGYSSEEIINKVKERIPFNQTSFAIESVEYLYKGGRCSGIKNFVVSKLGLKPRILMENGKMHPSKVFRGSMRHWVEKYVEATFEQFNNPDHELAFVTYSSCEDMSIIEDVAKKVKELGFKKVYITRAGGTICCHCGPNCLGVLYMNDGDHPIEKKQ